LDRGDVQWHFPAKGCGVLARDVHDPSQSPRSTGHRLSVKESTGGLSEDGRTFRVGGSRSGMRFRTRTLPSDQAMRSAAATIDDRNDPRYSEVIG
jgi:hypothetical protein